MRLRPGWSDWEELEGDAGKEEDSVGEESRGLDREEDDGDEVGLVDIPEEGLEEPVVEGVKLVMFSQGDD
jgi:hypothetical protein